MQAQGQTAPAQPVPGAGQPRYVFVPAGNVYITRNCKKLTLEAGKRVKIADKGIRVPADIYQTVLDSEKATRESRHAAVSKVDKKEKDEARVCLLEMFPSLPPGADEAILARAWERSSGRVGRTSKLSLSEKVNRAVVAHVRHWHTNYERRLHEEFVKNGGQRVSEQVARMVREETSKELRSVVRSWRARAGGKLGGGPQYEPVSRNGSQHSGEKSNQPIGKGKGKGKGKGSEKGKKGRKSYKVRTPEQQAVRRARKARRRERQAQARMEMEKAKEAKVKEGGVEVGAEEGGAQVNKDKEKSKPVEVIVIDSDSEDLADDGEDDDCLDFAEEDFFYAEELDDDDYTDGEW